MDYSKLSDFEINKAVAKSIGAVDVRQLKSMINEVYCEIDGVRSFKDFCNNPSDAWPIIVENKIDIQFADDSLGGIGQITKYIEFDTDITFEFYDNDKALRAAMIVFLMMQGDKN